jgi:hypothetical protein
MIRIGISYVLAQIVLNKAGSAASIEELESTTTFVPVT